MVSARVSVTFNNLAGLAAQLQAKVEEAQIETADALVEGIQRRTRAEAYDTGELMAGWRREGTTVVNDVEHAQYVEFGTHKMPARPIARQEAEAIAPVYAERVRRVLG